MSDPDPPVVLIVGAGPAGLFAACELVRHGIKPRIVERRSGPHHEARGTALQPAVLASLERAGLIEPFLSAGVRIRHIQLWVQVCARSPATISPRLAAPMDSSAAFRNGAPRRSCASVCRAWASRSNSALK